MDNSRKRTFSSSGVMGGIGDEGGGGGIGISGRSGSLSAVSASFPGQLSGPLSGRAGPLSGQSVPLSEVSGPLSGLSGISGPVSGISEHLSGVSGALGGGSLGARPGAVPGGLSGLSGPLSGVSGPLLGVSGPISGGMPGVASGTLSSGISGLSGQILEPVQVSGGLLDGISAPLSGGMPGDVSGEALDPLLGDGVSGVTEPLLGGMPGGVSGPLSGGLLDGVSGNLSGVVSGVGGSDSDDSRSSISRSDDIEGIPSIIYTSDDSADVGQSDSTCVDSDAAGYIATHVQLQDDETSRRLLLDSECPSPQPSPQPDTTDFLSHPLAAATFSTGSDIDLELADDLGLEKTRTLGGFPSGGHLAAHLDGCKFERSTSVSSASSGSSPEAQQPLLPEYQPLTDYPDYAGVEFGSRQELPQRKMHDPLDIFVDASEIPEKIQPLLTGRCLVGRDVHISAKYQNACYVHLNWAYIRHSCAFLNLTILLGLMCVGIALLVQMPRGSECDPEHAWWQGSVLMEVDVPAYTDSDGDGIGDLPGLLASIDHIQSLGVRGLRLGSVLGTGRSSDVPPSDHWLNLTQVDPALGSSSNLADLASVLHERGLYLILDVPLTYRGHRAVNLEDMYGVLKAWLAMGVDGFYFLDITEYSNDPALVEAIHTWRNTLDQYTHGLHHKIIMIPIALLDSLSANAFPHLSHLLRLVDLIDVQVDLSSSPETLPDILKSATAWDSQASLPWINWNIARRAENGRSVMASREVGDVPKALRTKIDGPGAIGAENERLEATGGKIDRLETSGVDINGPKTSGVHIHGLKASSVQSNGSQASRVDNNGQLTSEMEVKRAEINEWETSGVEINGPKASEEEIDEWQTSETNDGDFKAGGLKLNEGERVDDGLKAVQLTSGDIQLIGWSTDTAERTGEQPEVIIGRRDGLKDVGERNSDVTVKRSVVNRSEVENRMGERSSESVKSRRGESGENLEREGNGGRVVSSEQVEKDSFDMVREGAHPGRENREREKVGYSEEEGKGAKSKKTQGEGERDESGIEQMMEKGTEDGRNMTMRGNEVKIGGKGEWRKVEKGGNVDGGERENQTGRSGGNKHGKTEKTLSQIERQSLGRTILILFFPGTVTLYCCDDLGPIARQEGNQLPVLNSKDPDFKIPKRQQFLDNSNDKNADWNVYNNTLTTLTTMVTARQEKVPIYVNGIFDYKGDYHPTKTTNYRVRHAGRNLVVLDRFFPRRNQYAVVANLGTSTLDTDLSRFYYGGSVLASSHGHSGYVTFRNITLEPGEALACVLDL